MSDTIVDNITNLDRVLYPKESLINFNNVVTLLPGGFYIFRPLLDIAAAWVPVLFLLFAFLWQSAIGFR